MGGCRPGATVGMAKDGEGTQGGCALGPRLLSGRQTRLPKEPSLLGTPQTLTTVDRRSAAALGCTSSAGAKAPLRGVVVSSDLSSGVHRNENSKITWFIRGGIDGGCGCWSFGKHGRSALASGGWSDRESAHRAVGGRLRSLRRVLFLAGRAAANPATLQQVPRCDHLAAHLPIKAGD